MEEESNKVHPSLPANYVTLVDLRERWMQQQQKQSKGDEDNRDNEIQRNVKVQDEGVADGNQLDQKHPPLEKSLLQSNPNPKSSTRRLSYGNRHPTETRSCRWVQVSKSNSPTVLPLNQPKQALPVQRRQLKALPPPVVQIVEAKETPVINTSQSKPPPLDSPKVEYDVEQCGEIHSSGKTKEEKKKKKKRKSTRKRNDEKKDVAQSQPEKVVKENPEQGLEVGRGNRDADDNTGAEIEGKFAGLSLSNGTGENSGGKSITVRNRRHLRKEKGGDYGKFEGRVMLNKERAKNESGLVWVKKGEAS